MSPALLFHTKNICNGYLQQLKIPIFKMAITNLFVAEQICTS